MRHVPSCVTFVPALSLLVEAKAQDNRNSILLAMDNSWTTAASWTSRDWRFCFRMSPPEITGACYGAVDVPWIWPNRLGRFRDSLGGELTGR